MEKKCWIWCLLSLTLVCLEQFNVRGLAFTVLVLCPPLHGFCFDLLCPTVPKGGINVYPCPSVHTFVRPRIVFRFLTKVSRNQILWNWYTILNTIQQRSSFNDGGYTFTVLQLCPFTNWKNADIFISIIFL